MGRTSLLQGGPELAIKGVETAINGLPFKDYKDHWTLQWKGCFTCMTQGCIIGPQNRQAIEGFSDLSQVINGYLGLKMTPRIWSDWQDDAIQLFQAGLMKVSLSDFRSSPHRNSILSRHKHQP